MALLNKFILLAIIVLMANYATGGFLFEQADKVDFSSAQDPLVCGVAAYITTPLIGGLPLNFGVDDAIVTLVLTFLTLGILSWFNVNLRNLQKLGIFFFWVLIYKAVGMLMLYSVPGCFELANEYSHVIEPLTPLFLLLGLIFVFKFLKARKR